MSCRRCTYVVVSEYNIEKWHGLVEASRLSDDMITSLRPFPLSVSPSLPNDQSICLEMKRSPILS